MQQQPPYPRLEYYLYQLKECWFAIQRLVTNEYTKKGTPEYNKVFNDETTKAEYYYGRIMDIDRYNTDAALSMEMVGKFRRCIVSNVPPPVDKKPKSYEGKKEPWFNEYQTGPGIGGRRLFIYFEDEEVAS